MEYSEIAVIIVQYICNIKPAQAVTISAEIHNVFDHNDPLAEIPFMEELALVVRKNKGLPILDVSTENLHKRFFEEISDDPPFVASELLKKWMDTADVFIDLSFRSNPAFYKSIPERSFKRLNLDNKDFRKLFEEKRKRLILLGFPTVGMAQYYNVDHHLLKKTYLSSLTINYFNLKKRCFILDAQIKKQEQWTIHTEQRTLHITLKGEPKCFYGDMTDDFIITLPTGFWQQEIDPATINGIFFCDQIYHDNYVWENVQLIWEHGKITDVETSEPQKNINLLKTLLYEDHDTICLNIGLNLSIKERCYFGPYDMVKYKNLSLILKTPKGEVSALAETASMIDDFGTNIFNEV